jgi:hypothetical protein
MYGLVTINLILRKLPGIEFSGQTIPIIYLVVASILGLYLISFLPVLLVCIRRDPEKAMQDFGNKSQRLRGIPALYYILWYRLSSFYLSRPSALELKLALWLFLFTGIMLIISVIIIVIVIFQIRAIFLNDVYFYHFLQLLMIFSALTGVILFMLGLFILIFYPVRLVKARANRLKLLHIYSESVRSKNKFSSAIFYANYLWYRGVFNRLFVFIPYVCYFIILGLIVSSSSVFMFIYPIPDIMEEFNFTSW